MVEELSCITLKGLFLDLSWVLGCLEILQLSQILGPYKRYFWEELWMVMPFLPFNPFRSGGSWILVLDRFNYHKLYISFSTAHIGVVLWLKVRFSFIPVVAPRRLLSMFPLICGTWCSLVCWSFIAVRKI